MTFIPNKEFYFQAAQGLVPGYSSGILRGYNDSFTTSEVQLANTAFSWPIANTAFEINCANAFDTSAGSGARSILVESLDDNFAYQTETIATNGGTVALTKNARRILRAHVVTCGTYDGNNIGNIQIRVSGGGTVHATILASIGRTERFYYCVPANTRLWMMQLHLYPETNKDVRFRLYERENADITSGSVSAKKLEQRFVGLSTGLIIPYFDAPKPFEAKTDIFMNVFTTTGNASAGAEMVYILEDL